jgi:hypothetical protein
MRSSETIAEHDLRLAKAVNNGDRYLVAARTTHLQRSFGEFERGIGRQRLVGDDCLFTCARPPSSKQSRRNRHPSN